MSESTKDKDKCALKRSKMRESLDGAFGDPLIDFKTPEAVRRISQAINDESARLEDRIREISHSSNNPVGSEPGNVSLYVDQREQLAEDIEAHLKESRKIIHEAFAAASSGPERKELKKVLKELDKTESSLLKERSTLAAHRARVKLSMSGQFSSVKVSEAYVVAITQNLPAPSGSSCEKEDRSSTDQTSFRNRLIKAYNAEGSKILETPPEFETASVWCPVSGRYFPPLVMRAAHIVPYSVGELSAAYLFGSKPEEGYDVIWSERNGMMLHHSIERVFDDGRMVIVPDQRDSNEFVCVVLSQALLKEKRLCPAVEALYSTLHHRRLQFQTAARPGKRYLYVHALISLFRRRRYDIPGWEKDRSQVFSGKIWTTPGKWARKSMISAIAAEIGDNWEDLEEVDGLGEFPRAKSPEEEKKMATIVRFGWENKIGGTEVAEDDDE